MSIRDFLDTEADVDEDADEEEYDEEGDEGKEKFIFSKIKVIKTIF